MADKYVKLKAGSGIQIVEDSVAGTITISVPGLSSKIDTTALADIASSILIAGVKAKDLAAANVYYVTPGTAADVSLKTIIENVLATYDVAWIKAGSYTASAEINIPAGKHVVIEPGATIDANTGVSVFRIQGSGVTFSGGGKLRGKSTASVDPYTFAIANGPVVSGCIVQNLIIEDFGNPVVFTDSVKCTVRDCTITGYRSMGIWFNSSVANAFSDATQDATAYNNRVSTTYGSYTTGIQAKGIFVSGVRPVVLNNEVDGNATLLSTGYAAGQQVGQRDGIWLNWCQDFFCHGNKSRNNVDDGITVFRSVRGLVSGNILTDSYITVGILCLGGADQYCEDVYIVGNKAFRNGYGGMASLYGRNIYYSGNEIKDNGATAYLAVNSLAGFGILSEVGQSVTIAGGNIIAKNKRTGIHGKTVNLGGGTILNNSGLWINGATVEGHPQNIMIQGDPNTKHDPVIIDAVSSRNASQHNAFLENVKRVEINGGSYGAASGFLAGNQYGIYASGVLDFVVNGPSIRWTTNSSIYCKPFTTTPAGEKLNATINNLTVERVGDGIANVDAAAIDAEVDVLNVRALNVDYADKRGVRFTPRDSSAVCNISGADGYRIGAFNVNYGRFIEVMAACAQVHFRNVSVLCDQVFPNAPRCLYAVVTPNGCTNVLAMNIDAIRASSGVSLGTATRLKQVNVITSYA